VKIQKKIHRYQNNHKSHNLVYDIKLNNHTINKSDVNLIVKANHTNNQIINI